MNRQDFERGWALHKSDPRFSHQEELAFLEDDVTSYGYDSHYVMHTAWAARVLAEINPERHVDISGYVYFVAIASAFVPIDFYDYRALYLPVSNVTTRAADLTNLSTRFAPGSVRSLSCMHTLEHVGLGRYGDTLDPQGDIKAALELQSVLAPGGDLLVVVPVGRPRLCFNAHRIYSYEQVLAMFPNLYVREFALIPDGPPALIRNAAPELVQQQGYACGCFWLRAPAAW